MKKSIFTILAIALMFSSSAFAQNKIKKSTVSPASQVVEIKKEKYFKVEWFVKKTGKLVVTRSTVINMSDPENQSKTGKLVFAPERISSANNVYFLGLGIDMKLFENKGSPVLGMVGLYTDPYPLFDFTEKMPDEQNVAHIALQAPVTQILNGKQITLNSAKFVKAYDISSPSNQEITLTRFIIQEPQNASLIEISFKIYEFNVSDKDKPKD